MQVEEELARGTETALARAMNDKDKHLHESHT